MIGWNSFIFFAAAASLCWIVGAGISLRSKKTLPAIAVSLLGSAVFLAFICGMWMSLQRYCFC